MKTNRYLFPTYFKTIGWSISIPTAVVLAIYVFSSPFWEKTSEINILSNMFPEPYWRVLELFGDYTNWVTICMILLIIGLLFIAFAKEKTEDEYISKVRGDSLIWAVVTNSIVLIFASALIYNMWFLYVALLNLYSVLILFIIKFNWTLSKSTKTYDHEE